jgi:type I restriction enzyme S subunit
MKWPTITLEQATEKFLSGGTPSTSNPALWAGEIPWITGADFGDGGINIGRRFIHESALENSATNIVPKGAVLLVTRTGVGKIALADKDIAISQDITGIIPKPCFNSKFVLYAIRSSNALLTAAQRGATIKGVTRDVVKKIPLPFIGISEQRKIVGLLDEADRLRKLRREADTKVARILPTLFIEMFGDPATNTKGLRKEPLGKLVKFRSGDFLPAKDMAKDGKYPVYGGNGINGFHDEYMFEDSKIILGRVGAYCGAVHYSDRNSWITDNALYVSEKLEPIEDQYLVAALEQANLNQYAGRAGQPLISGSRIYPVEILVPAEAEQLAFARSVSDLRKVNDFLDVASRKLDSLWDTLMTRAFSGQLTAKWREGHMKELLAEMKQQARMLNLPVQLETTP